MPCRVCQLCFVADSAAPAAVPGSSAGSADFPGATFSGADLSESDFSESDFSGAASVSLSVSLPSADAVTARGSTISSRPGRRFAETIM
ncbi:pentapeptide repeat-containing protein [Streptomyces sp. NEAU-sy36]|uniref:pentapeptide repeat-containing protein n=1 Tax=unclassified Streptomyces TaxID=2593676 RepID=UPI0035A6B3EA